MAGDMNQLSDNDISEQIGLTPIASQAPSQRGAPTF